MAMKQKTRKDSDKAATADKTRTMARELHFTPLNSPDEPFVSHLSPF